MYLAPYILLIVAVIFLLVYREKFFNAILQLLIDVIIMVVIVFGINFFYPLDPITIVDLWLLGSALLLAGHIIKALWLGKESSPNQPNDNRWFPQ